MSQWHLLSIVEFWFHGSRIDRLCICLTVVNMIRLCLGPLLWQYDGFVSDVLAAVLFWWVTVCVVLSCVRASVLLVDSHVKMFSPRRFRAPVCQHVPVSSGQHFDHCRQPLRHKVTSFLVFTPSIETMHHYYFERPLAKWLTDNFMFFNGHGFTSKLQYFARGHFQKSLRGTLKPGLTLFLLMIKFNKTVRVLFNGFTLVNWTPPVGKHRWNLAVL